MAKLLGLLFGKHKTQGASKLEAVAAGSLEGNVLPLLRHRLSSRVKKVLMLCRYQALTTDFFFIGNGISVGIGRKLSNNLSTYMQRNVLKILLNIVG